MKKKEKRKPTRSLTFFATFSVLISVSLPSRADGNDDRLTWNEEWPRFRTSEYIVTAAAGTASLVTFLALKPPAQPNWTGGILFDDAARDALRLRSPGARDTIRTISDVTAVSSAVIAVGVDSILIPILRQSGDVALQLFLMDAEAYSFSTLLTTVMYDSIGRARPSYGDCQQNPNFDPLCNTSATASFPSGHSNAAFTAAGLSCAHHTHLALYGSPLADGLACGGMVTLATATATFRVLGDRHYVSDVLVGGLIGFGFGYATPMLLHYGAGHSADTAGVTLSPLAGSSDVGLQASGTF